RHRGIRRRQGPRLEPGPGGGPRRRLHARVRARRGCARRPMILASGIPSPAHGAWHLGPLPIRAYAIAILARIALGAWIAIRRYRQRGGPENTVVDALFWAVPAGIIGARLYHVFSSPDAYFGPDGDLVRALYIWEGGLGIWGAIPAGALAAWLFLR